MDRTLLLLLLVAIGIHTSQAECQCGVFLLLGGPECSKEFIFEGPTVPQTCEVIEGDMYCHEYCSALVLNVTGDGFLSTRTKPCGITSGQVMCNALGRDVINGVVAGFYRWCITSFKDLDYRTADLLCCQKGKHLNCEDVKPSISPEISATEGPECTTPPTECGGRFYEKIE